MAASSSYSWILLYNKPHISWIPHLQKPLSFFMIFSASFLWYPKNEWSGHSCQSKACGRQMKEKWHHHHVHPTIKLITFQATCKLESCDRHIQHRDDDYKIKEQVPTLLILLSTFCEQTSECMRIYLWGFRVKRIEVIYKYFVLDVSEDKLIFKAEERADRMFVEFDALHNLVGGHVDLIENVSTHYRIDGLILPWTNAINCPARLVDRVRLPILHHPIHTEMFQVLMVPSCDPLTSTLLKTNRFETLFVCPMNWFKI